jgi:tetratricopeptide (TPR) repeat protein
MRLMIGARCEAPYPRREACRFLLILGLLAVAGTAHAGSSDDAARIHYERGQAKYNLADFDSAIDEFKQSYELSKAPRLLFNIAQAYRLKKDWERALYFYNTYLRNDPNAPNREDVETRIDEMKQKLDEESHTTSTPPPVIAPPVTPPSPPPTVTTSRGPSARRLKIAGGTTLGLGLAIGAVGGGMLGLASADANQISNLVKTGGQWSNNVMSTYDEGMHSQTAGIALISVGAAVATAGLVVTLVGVRKARRH